MSSIRADPCEVNSDTPGLVAGPSGDVYIENHHSESVAPVATTTTTGPLPVTADSLPSNTGRYIKPNKAPRSRKPPKGPSRESSSLIRSLVMPLLGWRELGYTTRDEVVAEREYIQSFTDLLPPEQKSRVTWFFSQWLFKTWLKTTTNTVDGFLVFSSNEEEPNNQTPSPTSLACSIIEKHHMEAGYFVLTWHAALKTGSVFQMMKHFCSALIDRFYPEGERDKDLYFVRTSGIYHKLSEAHYLALNPTKEQFEAIIDLWYSLLSRLPHEAKVIVLIDGVDYLESHSEDEEIRTSQVLDAFVHTVKEKRGVRRKDGDGYPKAKALEESNGNPAVMIRKKFETSQRQFKVIAMAHTSTVKSKNWYQKPCRIDHRPGPTPGHAIDSEPAEDPDLKFQEVWQSIGDS